jgi:putative restriction endonuclease
VLADHLLPVAIDVALRAAMPFVHLERELWDPRDADGREIGPDVPSAALGFWITAR